MANAAAQPQLDFAKVSADWHPFLADKKNNPCPYLRAVVRMRTAEPGWFEPTDLYQIWSSLCRLPHPKQSKDFYNFSPDPQKFKQLDNLVAKTMQNRVINRPSRDVLILGTESKIERIQARTIYYLASLPLNPRLVCRNLYAKFPPQNADFSRLLSITSKNRLGDERSYIKFANKEVPSQGLNNMDLKGIHAEGRESLIQLLSERVNVTSKEGNLVLTIHYMGKTYLLRAIANPEKKKIQAGSIRITYPLIFCFGLDFPMNLFHWIRAAYEPSGAFFCPYEINDRSAYDYFAEAGICQN